MNTFFSDSDNENRLLGTKSKQTVNFPKTSLSLAPSKNIQWLKNLRMN